MEKCLLYLTGILFATSAHAGIFEVSASANYRKTNFDATHSSAMETGTASIAYYFWEVSAIEFSYTIGNAEQLQPEYNAYQSLTAYGVNFLVTMANRDSALKPYLKVGAAYVIKDLRYMIPNFFTPITIITQGIAPTAGFGFKLMVGQQFAVKAGIDVDSSPLSVDPVTYDLSATGGISFLF